MKLTMRIFAVVLSSFLLVSLYVNTFDIWRAIGRYFGSTARDALPILSLVLLLLGAFGMAAFRTRKRKSFSPAALGAAILVGAIGFFAVDPSFPAKRIHVFQYAVLAFLVWQIIPKHQHTVWTSTLVLVLGAVYGVHDEFLQGLHPKRTYGLRDMFVNLCGVGAGLLLIRAFSHHRPMTRRQGDVLPDVRSLVALVALLISIVLFAYAATGYRRDLMPIWTLLPLLSAGLLLSFTNRSEMRSGYRTIEQTIVFVSLLLSLYPIIVYVADFEFA